MYAILDFRLKYYGASIFPQLGEKSHWIPTLFAVTDGNLSVASIKTSINSCRNLNF